MAASENHMVFTKIKMFACIILTVILIGGFAIYSFWEWVFVIPDPPSCKLEKLSVSNVTTSFPGFTINLDVKVKVTNPSSILKTRFEEINSWVYYENEYIAASGFVEPFSLKAGKNKEIDIKYSAKDTDLGKLGKWIVEKIANERASKGTVTFSFSMVFTTKRRFGLLKQQEGLNLYCQNIRVVLGDSPQGSAATASCWSGF